ncbi:JmjC domain, hydroxylase-domain-containing protein [Syncephalastrum racemosum]|uniref:[histone H3]-trimethyl-L-lysine(9) demethylase n=1 Tax=Syncephalastrum racemosum TaxID=13706 RepID=A0A1X2HC57_SYNRA|nr:JmjC domain, hydroxylase-domain-containing protein [Syncephalastrum racemosum]
MSRSPIEPSEYYDQENGGQIPVFRPSMEQFEDFMSFMESIDDYGRRSGIVKVIPPEEWKQSLPSVRSALEHVRVRNPIVQHIYGSKGTYAQTNVEKRRPYTLSQWHELCHQEPHRPPKMRADRTASPLHRIAVPQDPKRQKSSLVQPVSANTRSKAHSSATPAATSTVPATATATAKSKRQKSSDEIALARSDATVPLDFDPYAEDIEQYTMEYCKHLERVYWRNLTYSQPMYGADMLGTLFDESVTSWNVSKLDNVLNRMGASLPGVNEPYLYFGMWKATFAWHVEDMDLYSINYLHFGAPKQWYAIPADYSKKFESIMQNEFFQQYKACPEFLRHKTFLMSPSLLEKYNVPVNRCVQHQGEFMITFPFGYHAGYNLGFNCAESVNFALDSWIEIGKQAKACNCISDSVTIDVASLERPENSRTSEEGEKDVPRPSSNKTSPTKKTNRRKRTNTDNSALPEPKKPATICILCSNSTTKADITTMDGSARAHRRCAEIIPETSVTDNDILQGLDTIPKARWKLLCQICKQRTGACVQCCKGRCYKAFHVTCAETAGLTMIHRGKSVADIYCAQHKPQQQRQQPQQKQHREKKKEDDKSKAASQSKPIRKLRLIAPAQPKPPIVPIIPPQGHTYPMQPIPTFPQGMMLATSAGEMQKGHHQHSNYCSIF